MRFSILISLFHVKQSYTCSCSLAFLMFHMKHYQAGTFLPLPFASLVHRNTQDLAEILNPHLIVSCETIWHMSLFNGTHDVSHETLLSRYVPPLHLASLDHMNTQDPIEILNPHFIFSCEAIWHVSLLANATDVSHETSPSWYFPPPSFTSLITWNTNSLAGILYFSMVFHVKQKDRGFAQKSSKCFTWNIANLAYLLKSCNSSFHVKLQACSDPLSAHHCFMWNNLPYVLVQ